MVDSLDLYDRINEICNGAIGAIIHPANASSQAEERLQYIADKYSQLAHLIEASKSNIISIKAVSDLVDGFVNLLEKQQNVEDVILENEKLNHRATLDAEALVSAQVKNLELLTSHERMLELQEELDTINEKSDGIEANAMIELANSKRIRNELEKQIILLENERAAASKSVQISNSARQAESEELKLAYEAKEAAESQLNGLETHIDSLNQIIHNNETRIQSLEEEVEGLSCAREALAQRVQDMEASLRGLDRAEAGMAQAQQTRMQAEHRATRLTTELDAARQETVTQENTAQKLRDDSAVLHEALCAAKNDLDIASRRVAVVEAELSCSQLQTQAGEAQLAAAANTLAQVQEELSRRHEDYNTQCEVLESMGRKLEEALTVQLTDKEAIAELQATVDELDKSVRDAQGALSMTQNANDLFLAKRACQQAEALSAEVTSKLELSDARCGQLSKTIESMTSDQHDLVQAQAALTSKCTALEMKIRAIPELEAQVTSAMSEVTRMSLESTRLKYDMKESQQQFAVLDQERATLTARIAQMEACAALCDTTFTELRSEIAVLIEQRERAAEDDTLKLQDQQDLTAEAARLRVELSDCQLELKSLGEDFDQKVVLNNAANQEIDDLQAVLHEKVQEVSELRELLQSLGASSEARFSVSSSSPHQALAVSIPACSNSLASRSYYEDDDDDDNNNGDCAATHTFVLPMSKLGFKSSVSVQPIVFLELGSYMTRVGVWNAVNEEFDLTFSCLSAVAKCSGAQSPRNVLETVRGASVFSDPMYMNFRDTGMFVGKNANYCLFDHPDSGLRSSLSMDSIMTDGKILNKAAFCQLLQQCVSLGVAGNPEVASELQVLVAYKLTMDSPDLEALGEALFEHLQCRKVCLVSEASLAATCTVARQDAASAAIINSVSTLIVDIGAMSTTVYPCYEGIIMRNAVRTCGVGGEHCSILLEKMLHAKAVQSFNGQLPRRRLAMARQIKEQCAFVADSFHNCKAKYGTFEFEYVKVMSDKASHLDDDSARPSITSHKSVTTKLTSTLASQVNLSLNDGADMTVTVDRERFYCTEVLFQPNLLECVSEQEDIVNTIVQAVEAVDESVREEVCAKILVTGGSSGLAGLGHRLHTELSHILSESGVPNFRLVCEGSGDNSNNYSSADEQLNVESCKSVRSSHSDTSAVWRGATTRMRHIAIVPFDSQNFVTDVDYADMGPALLENVLI